MGDASERRLRARLQRVEALHRGATTLGEREAAARARQRLLARIDDLRANDPIARFCAEHLSELGVESPPPPPPDPGVGERELLDALALWELGDWTADRLHEWACAAVDRATLALDPDAADAAVGEVLLQLAALHHVELRPTDVPRIRRFVRERVWADWFALLADAAARGARLRRAG